MVLMAVVQQDHAPIQDLLKNSYIDASINVPQGHNGCYGVTAKCPVLQVLHSQLVQQVPLSLQAT